MEEKRKMDVNPKKKPVGWHQQYCFWGKTKQCGETVGGCQIILGVKLVNSMQHGCEAVHKNNGYTTK